MHKIVLLSRNAFCNSDSFINKLDTKQIDGLIVHADTLLA